ncbi:MAG: hypothetical protein AAF495_01150 [Pseudomonadota bacterium]
MDGKDLKIGDWVRVLMVPLSVSNLPMESKAAFSKAVGYTFQIVAFDAVGCLELDLFAKVGPDTIWLEPYCVKRFRRYKWQSKAFQKKLEVRARPLPPQIGFTFEIVLTEGADIELFERRLSKLRAGFAVWPEQRRFSGSFGIDKTDPNALEELEEARRKLAELEQIQSCTVGEITDS